MTWKSLKGDFQGSKRLGRQTPSFQSSMSDHDAQSAIHRFIFEDAIEDEDSNDDEEDVNSKESQNTTWKQLKAKIETQARSQAKIQPLEHKVRTDELMLYSTYVACVSQHCPGTKN